MSCFVILLLVNELTSWRLRWYLFSSFTSLHAFKSCFLLCLAPLCSMKTKHTGTCIYGGPQLSHQNIMLTANYKSFTSNSNRSQQIQIAHSKYNSLTANTNPCSKYKYGLRIQIRGVRTADCRLRTRGKSRLRVKCRLQTKDNMQARG